MEICLLQLNWVQLTFIDLYRGSASLDQLCSRNCQNIIERPMIVILPILSCGYLLFIFSHIYVFCVIATNKTFHQQHSAANCLQKSQFSLSPPANASIVAALLVYFSISSTKPKMWHFECHPQLTASFCFNQFRIWQTQFGINSNITVFLKFNLTNWSVCGIHLHKYNRLSILWAVYCSRVNCQH